MFIIRGDEDVAAIKSPQEMQQHMQHWQKWMGNMAEQGKFVAGQPLMNEGKSITERGNKVIDRPLAEGKELIGGYIIVKTSSLAEATEMPGWQQAYIIPRKSFLATEDADSKRLHRTKEYFRKTRIRPQIPTQQEIISRTNAVLNSIYLMFNEGYNATHTEKLIREDLISQTMLLCKALIENEKTRLPEIYALMALMCLHSSRNEGRLTSEDELIPLNKQDRSTWNRELISMGNDYLNKSAFGKNPYTLPF